MDLLKKIETCEFEGCDRGHHAKGLCRAHYMQHWRGEELRPLAEPVVEARPRPECLFPECGNVVKGNGLCAGHYHQHWRGEELSPLKKHKTGRYGPQTTHLPLIQRLATLSVRDNDTGCLLWARNVTPAGYASVFVEGKSRAAHRASYELHVGAIPKGRVLDHICGVRSCIEPSHLRVVTPRQNGQYRPRLSSSNSSGFSCIRYRPEYDYWDVRIVRNGACNWLGPFDSAQEANAAAMAWRVDHCEMGDPEVNKTALRKLWQDRRADLERLSRLTTRRARGWGIGWDESTITTQGAP